VYVRVCDIRIAFYEFYLLLQFTLFSNTSKVALVALLKLSSGTATQNTQTCNRTNMHVLYVYLLRC